MSGSKSIKTLPSLAPTFPYKGDKPKNHFENNEI